MRCRCRLNLKVEENEFIEVEKDIWIELSNLGLTPGTCFFIKGVKVTKTQEFTSFNVAGKWKRKLFGVSPKKDGLFSPT